jgi:hypothetical protein
MELFSDVNIQKDTLATWSFWKKSSNLATHNQRQFGQMLYSSDYE